MVIVWLSSVFGFAVVPITSIENGSVRENNHLQHHMEMAGNHNRRVDLTDAAGQNTCVDCLDAY